MTRRRLLPGAVILTALAAIAPSAAGAADPAITPSLATPAAVETPVPVPSGRPIGLVPDGTYRLSHTKEGLVATGLTAADASNNAGTWTWRFTGDRGSWTLDHAHGGQGVCEGTFEIRSDRVRMTCGVDWVDWLEFRWTLVGDQLSVTVIDNETGTTYDVAAERAIFGGPWTKVE